MKTKILIEIRDGLVLNTISDNTEVEITVIDYDAIENNSEPFPYYHAAPDEILPDAGFDDYIEFKENTFEEILED